MANTDIQIQILQTGSITIRPTMYTQPPTRPLPLRLLHILSDRQWRSPPLPVHTYLITHPTTGPILFDTGMSPSCNDPGFFPWWCPAIKTMSRLSITPAQGIGAQLRDRGIEPDALSAVVLSHLHHDHSGGLADVQGAPVLMSQEHWEAFKSPTAATLQGAAPKHWPRGFTPGFLQATGGPVGPFEKSYPVTGDGRVVAVETPGHMRGHMSLVVFGEGTTYFLTGDATYDLESLDAEVTDGACEDPVRAVETLRKIKQLARERPLVVLPSHDLGATQRLEEKIVYRPSG